MKAINRTQPVSMHSWRCMFWVRSNSKMFGFHRCSFFQLDLWKTFRTDYNPYFATSDLASYSSYSACLYTLLNVGLPYFRSFRKIHFHLLWIYACCSLWSCGEWFPVHDGFGSTFIFHSRSSAKLNFRCAILSMISSTCVCLVVSIDLILYFNVQHYVVTRLAQVHVVSTPTI